MTKASRSILPAVMLILLVSPTWGNSGSGATHVTFLNNGSPADNYDLVLVFDGYLSPTTVPNGTWWQDGQNFVNALLLQEPFQTYQNYFNIHGVFRPSCQAGADHPPTYSDTAYNATYSALPIGLQCVLLQDAAAITQPLGSDPSGLTLAQSDAMNAPGCDGQILAIVNDPVYGGCALYGNHGAAYNGTHVLGNGPEVAIHELGHLFGFLGDEYGGSGLAWMFGEPPERNLTTVLPVQKWGPWLPTPGIGAVAGGFGYDAGIYHPKLSCMMNLNTPPYCEVCQEELVMKIYDIATPFASESPSTAIPIVSSPGNFHTFTFTHRVPGATQVQWTVDGVVQSSTTTSFTWNTTAASLGTHTVTAALTDQASLVLNDPYGRMTDFRTWTVNMPAPDLTLTDVSHGGVPVAAGSSMNVSATVLNQGTLDSGAFNVEWYLGTSPTPNPFLDHQIGTTTVASLAINSSVNVNVTASTLFLLFSGTYYLHAQIDRLNSVAELNEANNSLTGAASVSITAPPITTVTLEFDESNNIGGQTSTLSAAAGGIKLLTITAPNHPGEWYLLGLGITGSTPGFPVAPGINLPLNLDWFTYAALPFYGSPMMIGFTAPLSGLGSSTAFFAPTPAFLPAGITITFAGVLYLPGPNWTGATTAVNLTVLP